MQNDTIESLQRVCLKNFWLHYSTHPKHCQNVTFTLLPLCTPATNSATNFSTTWRGLLVNSPKTHAKTTNVTWHRCYKLSNHHRRNWVSSGVERGRETKTHSFIHSLEKGATKRKHPPEDFIIIWKLHLWNWLSRVWQRLRAVYEHAKLSVSLQGKEGWWVLRFVLKSRHSLSLSLPPN